MTEEEYWHKEWKEVDKKLAKANFTIGWLTSALEGTGFSREEVKAVLETAMKEADRIYK